MHARLEQWWNGISLRAKVTGVTVLLLTAGLMVAGVGSMTVLRTYLHEQADIKLDSFIAQVQEFSPQDLEQALENCNVTYEPLGSLFAVVDAEGEPVCSNVPRGKPEPDLSEFDLSRTTQLGDDGRSRKVTVSDAVNQHTWRVVASLQPIPPDGTYGTLVIGVDLAETEATITRSTVIFFGFAIAVVVLGAATTQLLVTSTFAPLRDVERTAARFAAGDYSQRLGGATPNTEVGRLNRSLNTMLARIDRAFADRQRTVEQMRRLVADASHELRTPLVSLRGYAELYRMGALQKEEDVAQAMERIEKEAIRMGALVEDLLELARLDEARPLELRPVDLLPIAQDAALDASASNPDREITVVVPEPVEPVEGDEGVAEPETPDATPPVRAANQANPVAGALARLVRRRPAKDDALPAAPPELPEVGPIVLAEGDKIRQVVTNLIGNAMRFSPKGSPIEIVVGVDRVRRFGTIAIVDHGPGIPPQLREKIFERFYRADSSRTRDTGGSGLGLAIVAGIVANHNGHVEVFETPGGGATFHVSLPLDLGAPTPGPGDDRSGSTGDDSAAKGRESGSRGRDAGPKSSGKSRGTS